MLYQKISWFLQILIIVIPLLAAVAFFTLAERKILASIHKLFATLSGWSQIIS